MQLGFDLSAVVAVDSIAAVVTVVAVILRLPC